MTSSKIQLRLLEKISNGDRVLIMFATYLDLLGYDIYRIKNRSGYDSAIR